MITISYSFLDWDRVWSEERTDPVDAFGGQAIVPRLYRPGGGI